MTAHELTLYSKITDHVRERSELERLKRKLDRETRAREEAEKLLEERSGQLFDVVDSLEQQMSKTKLLSSAVEAAQDGIAITDAGGNFQYLNRAHESMFDYYAGELVGQNWSVLYDSVSLLRFEREIMPEFAKVGRWRGEAIGVAKTGRSVYQEVTLTALPNGGLICATRDVSSRRESERKLRDLSDKLRVAEREAALFTVASAITHDMNNLLFALRGHALLLDQQIDNNTHRPASPTASYRHTTRAPTRFLANPHRYQHQALPTKRKKQFEQPYDDAPKEESSQRKKAHQARQTKEQTSPVPEGSNLQLCPLRSHKVPHWRLNSTLFPFEEVFA